MSKNYHCYLQLVSGLVGEGHTNDIDHDSAFINGSQFANGARPARHGDTGLLTLHFLKQGRNASLRMRCQVLRTQTFGVGVRLFSNELTEVDRDTLEKLLGSGEGVE